MRGTNERGKDEREGESRERVEREGRTWDIIHTHTHACTNIYTHTNILTYMHTHVYIIYTHSCKYIHICAEEKGRQREIERGETKDERFGGGRERER